MEELKHIAEWITNGIEFVATLILLWGVVKALWLFSQAEYLKLTGRIQKVCHLDADARTILGNHLLLGLELMIAADIIHTVFSRTQEDLNPPWRSGRYSDSC